VSQQTSLKRKGLDSFDKGDNTAGNSRIEAIFSDNGGTWNRLSNFPAGSMIMGKVPLEEQGLFAAETFLPKSLCVRRRGCRALDCTGALWC
jgi:hypothetical protein